MNPAKLEALLKLLMRRTERGPDHTWDPYMRQIVGVEDYGARRREIDVIPDRHIDSMNEFIDSPGYFRPPGLGPRNTKHRWTGETKDMVGDSEDLYAEKTKGLFEATDDSGNWEKYGPLVLPTENKLFRGETFFGDNDDYLNRLEELESGVLGNRYNLSTSADPTTAWFWRTSDFFGGGPKGIMYEIDTPAGTPGFKYNAGEMEVLLPEDLKFDINDIRQINTPLTDSGLSDNMKDNLLVRMRPQSIKLGRKK